MKIRVRTVWQDKVAVRDKQLKQILALEEDLIIEHNKQTMTIEFENIKKSIKGKSDQAFRDKFSNESHYLYYFDWKPEEDPQLSLL